MEKRCTKGGGAEGTGSSRGRERGEAAAKATNGGACGNDRLKAMLARTIPEDFGFTDANGEVWTAEPTVVHLLLAQMKGLERALRGWFVDSGASEQIATHLVVFTSYTPLVPR